MTKKTKQVKAWEGEFGKEYTDRNIMSPDQADQIADNNYGNGLSRTKLNKEFLGDLNIDKILEVGCNIANQLVLLQREGYENLWGIDPQEYALEIAKKKTEKINLVKASAFDIPFKDNYFDLIFTTGVLIHIDPKDLGKAMDEMYRCSKRYILGFEYYVPDKAQVIHHRGHDDLLWKADYAKLFLERFPDLKLVRKKILKYKNQL